MYGRTGFRKEKIKTKFMKSYKEQEIMESHNRHHPEGTWYIEDLLQNLFLLYEALLTIIINY